MWQVIGQDKLLALLDRSLKQHSIAHSYLLLGPPHIGKRTMALNLAQAVNCDDLQPPCGQCSSCRRIIEDKHPDVTILTFDSKREVESEADDTQKARQKVKIGTASIEDLQHLANLPPYEGHYKVFIIENAENMSTAAANRLLKILEEPPPRVIWLLLSAQEARLLPTVTSRCQRLELKSVPRQTIQEMLTASYGIEDEKAALLARLSNGCPGWALSALADSELLQQRSQKMERLSSLLDAGLETRFALAEELAVQFGRDRMAVMDTMAVWLSWWRDLMLIKGRCKKAIINVDYERELEEQAGSLSLRKIEDFITALRSTRENIARNVNARLAFESLMLNLPARSDGTSEGSDSRSNRTYGKYTAT